MRISVAGHHYWIDSSIFLGIILGFVFLREINDWEAGRWRMLEVEVVVVAEGGDGGVAGLVIGSERGLGDRSRQRLISGVGGRRQRRGLGLGWILA